MIMPDKINVTLILEKRKSIKITPSPEQLTVRAPLNTSEVEIANFLAQHKAWIHKHCQKKKEIFRIFNEEIDWSLTEKQLGQSLNSFDRRRHHKKKCIDELQRLYKQLLQQTPVIPPLSVKTLANAWGKCHSTKRIELHWKTATLPIELAAYVILHEYAHITHMNHSQQFWAHVGTFDKNARKHDRMLKNFSI